MALTKIQRAAVSAALFFLLLGLECSAAALHVSPVRVELGAGERSALITVRNEGNAAATLQADIHTWAQDEDGEDLLEDTEDLLIVPRIFSIPAGKSQVVRIGKLVENSTASERTYRLVLTELEPPDGGMQGSGLNVRLRLSMPVFLQPKNKTQAVVSFVRAQQSNDQLEVVLTNTGSATAQLLGFSRTGPIDPEASDPEIQVGGYLLPGATRRFNLPMPADGNVGTITAFTDKTEAVQYVVSGDN